MNLWVWVNSAILVVFGVAIVALIAGAAMVGLTAIGVVVLISEAARALIPRGREGALRAEARGTVGFCDECLLFEAEDGSGWPKSACLEPQCKFRQHQVRGGVIDTGHLMLRVPE